VRKPFGTAVRQRTGGARGGFRLGFTLTRGMRVGLFGGSFNPAHEGHAHVAETALKELGLDRVIWLVSPQNPLKSSRETEALAPRLAGARAKARGPKMIVSDVETRFGVQYTLDIIRILKARFPGVHFVWVMGADSLLSFHRWRGWVQIMRACPVAVVSRPGVSLKSRFSPAARRFARFRLPEDDARALPTRTAPAWVFLHNRYNFTSSTALRNARKPVNKA
jgi:nicotinate-nucleotide adenylyltransferase